MADYEPLREVRFGLVLYGGVSLAVYINGVVQELYHLIRATAPELDSEDQLLHDENDLTSTEHLYRQLGRMYGEPTVDVEDNGVPVRTRFIVDIISGSSAGGINGVYFAKALANQQDFGALRQVWIENAGVVDLIDDKKTRKARKERLLGKGAPEALFNGDVMYLELLDALDAMGGQSDEPTDPNRSRRSPYVNELDLWITATDLAGTPLPLRLSDKDIAEKSHRFTFHFVFGEAVTDQLPAGGTVPQPQIRNEFVRKMNPMLAFAARATSAYPFAFAPARLSDIERVRRRGEQRKRGEDPKNPEWAAWFANQRRVQDFDYENVCFGDGGDMDNKPFGWVIDTLPSRTSSTPASRRLLYVEPDPGDATVPDEAAPRPDVVDSTIAAVSLGRTENIRDDIEALTKLSTARSWISSAIEAVDDEIFATGPSLSTQEWVDEVGAALRARGPSHKAYLELRVKVLTTEFARSLVGLPLRAADTPEAAAIGELVRLWVNDTYTTPYEPVEGQPTWKEFLRDFDIAFRIRRLAFVAGRADRLHRTPGMLIDNDGAQASDEWIAEARSEARRLKQVLGQAERFLRLYVPSNRSNTPQARTEFRLADDAVASYRENRERWLDQNWPGCHDSLAKVAAGVQKSLDAIFGAAGDPVTAALKDTGGSDPARRVREWIKTYYDRFADFDQVAFPLQTTAGVASELDPIRVHRISPVDAPSLVDPTEREKVAGARLGHFGGFLDSRWRANDIMWGRLDAAERLITILIPEEPRMAVPNGAPPRSRRQELLELVQDQILQEEWYVEGRGGSKHLSEPAFSADTADGRRARRRAFREDYRVPPMPPTQDLVLLASRATDVTNTILEGLAARPGVNVVKRVVGVAGWLLSAVATVIYPAGVARTPLRFVSALVTAVGLVLFFISSALNWDSGTASATVLVAVGVASLMAVLVLRLLRRGTWKGRLMLVLGLVVAGLAIYGLWDLRSYLGDGVDWLNDRIGDR